MDWKQKLEAKAAARAAARAAAEEKELSNDEIKALRQAKANANAKAIADSKAKENAINADYAEEQAKITAQSKARAEVQAKARADAFAEKLAKIRAEAKERENEIVAYYAKAKANAAERALKANAKLAEEAAAKEAAKEAARKKYEAERAVQMEEARRRANEEFKEEEASMLRRVAKSDKPLTKMFVNLITKYLKLKLRFDKVTFILANLDKRGIDKALPSYSKYADEFKTINKSLASFKHMFDTFLDIGKMKKWRDTYVNGSDYSNILKQMYTAETSGLLLTEKWKSGHWERKNKANAVYEWRGLHDGQVPGLPGMTAEDQFKILEERDKKHISDNYKFKFPTFIHSYMETHKLFDMLVKKFPSEPTSQNNIADFNMLLPKFIENKVKVETKEEMFEHLFKHNEYMHILDGMYNAELSENFDNEIKDVKKAEDEKIKEELKTIVKPLGPEVRENENNGFGGGTRRNRRNRKNRRGTRRN